VSDRGLGDRIERIERELALLSRQPGMGSFGDVPLPSKVELVDRGTYVLLARLDEGGPLAIREIAIAFGLDDSTVNRKTATCVRDGVLERIPDPDGGMARKFRLTDLGRERLEAYRTWARAGLQRVLADWPTADLDALATSLDRLNRSIDDLRARAGR
jgi:DNA-binding MarR family transcriptional regulator